MDSNHGSLYLCTHGNIDILILTMHQLLSVAEQAYMVPTPEDRYSCQCDT